MNSLSWTFSIMILASICWSIVSKYLEMCPSMNHFVPFHPYLMEWRQLWHPLFGRKAWLLLQNVGSNISVKIVSIDFRTTLSLGLGMPKGRYPPSGFGMCTLLIGLKRYEWSLRALMVSRNHSLFIPSRVNGSTPFFFEISSYDAISLFISNIFLYSFLNIV